MIAWFGAMLALSVAVQDTVRDTTGTVAGTVRDTAGKPIPGATVRISLHQYTRTDSIGRYVLSEIQPGPVQLSAASLGYERVGRSGVVVSPGIITHVDLVMPDGPRGRRPFAIPCPAGATAPGGGTCVAARRLSYRANGPVGMGMIRDSAAFAAFVQRYRDFGAPGETAHTTPIDWRHEMVLLLTFGPVSGLNQVFIFNRAEIRDGEMVVTIGPDSLVGPVYMGPDRLLAEGYVPTMAIVLPRWDRAVLFERRIPETWLPPVVDWRLVTAADTTRRR